jgi:hypothetical protein
MRRNPLPVGRDAVGVVRSAVEAGQGAGEGGQVLLNKAPETCQERQIDRQIAITLQRQNTEISKQIFPEKEYRGLSPNFHIHAAGDLYISTISLPILLEEICRPML